jgi:GTP-binding protein LepA
MWTMGKSSLASRVLELTGNLGPEAQKIAWDATFGDPNATGVVVEASQKENINMLDTLSVEKERGITVKASTATMLYPHPAAVGPEGVLLLNMLDTPGHVDFGREVSRSLTFVQGAVLLLDASQGIQAQTWSVYEKAKSLLKPPQMLVALTKVDLDAARPIQVALTVSEWLDLDDPDAIITTSARNRVGITDILDAVCRRSAATDSVRR